MWYKPSPNCRNIIGFTWVYHIPDASELLRSKVVTMGPGVELLYHRTLSLFRLQKSLKEPQSWGIQHRLLKPCCWTCWNIEMLECGEIKVMWPVLFKHVEIRCSFNLKKITTLQPGSSAG
jgi:hypothetical protein